MNFSFDSFKFPVEVTDIALTVTVKDVHELEALAKFCRRFRQGGVLSIGSQEAAATDVLREIQTVRGCASKKLSDIEKAVLDLP